MAKDHVPSGFERPSGYKSDLEIAETGDKAKSINTSFGSKNHNAYIHRVDGTHEHFYYSPKDGKSGWHGYNYPTHNNHPKTNSANRLCEKTESEEKNMDRNSFIESLKVDKTTHEKSNETKNTNTHFEQNRSNTSRERNSFVESLKVDKTTLEHSKETSANKETNTYSHTSKSNTDDGGRDRGDTGPGSQGREAGYKGGLEGHGNAIGSNAPSLGISSGHGDAGGSSGDGGHGSGGHSNSGKGGH